MSWASKRQFKYLGGVFLFCALIILALVYPVLTKAPTCSDGKKNGDELGVDCGGSCSRFCDSQVSEPLILWHRAFPVTGSIYNLMAFVENQNKGAAVAMVSYEFKIYDTDNLLIGTRDGTTFIPPNQQFAVFEPRFDAGKSTIRTVSFAFTSPFIWVKKAPTFGTLPIHVDSVISGIDPSFPSLTARIVNDSIYDLPAFDVIAILYNSDHNVINISKTHKNNLDTNTNSSLLFTWPQPLSDTPVTNDIIVQVNPFTTSF